MAEALAERAAASQRRRPTVPLEVYEAAIEQHRLEQAKAAMQVVLYREELERRGIEPPDATGAELLAMWRSCRRVISSASEVITLLGTGKELLDDWGQR